MAYKYTKGSVIRGDIYNEDDTQGNTFIDWSEDAFGIVAGGSLGLTVSGSNDEISSSYNLSASAFYGDGSALSGITATASPAGSSGQIQFNDEGETGGAASLYWDETNSRVGIGTTSPGKTLTVVGDISASSALYGTDLVLKTNESSNIASIYIEGTSGTEIIGQSGGNMDIRSDGGTLNLLGGTGHALYLGSDNQTYRVTLDTDGNVGIGTTSPSKALDIEGADTAIIQLNATNYRSYNVGSDAYGFVIHDDTTGGTAGYRFVISDQAAALGYVGIGAGASIAGSNHPDALLHLSSSDDGAIFRADTTDGTTVLFATGSNRVGIGTDSPDHELTIVGNVSASVNISASAFYGDGSNLAGVSTTNPPWTEASSEVYYMGNVGCGIQNPSSTLHSGGSAATAITTINGTSTTVGATHHTILMGSDNNNCTVTLPAAGGCTGRIYVFKRVASSATVKVGVQSGEYIDGDVDAELTFDTQYDIKTVQSNGTQWWIIGEVHMGQ